MAQARAHDVEATVDASRALLAVVARSLADVLESITLAQYRVLVVLTAAGPTRMGVLADRVGVHQSTLTRTSDRLVAAGLVTRAPSPESRREVVLEITDEGAALVEQVMERRRVEIRLMLEQLTRDEQAAVRVGMTLLARVGGDPADELLALGM